MKNLGQLMKQAQQMQQKMAEMQAKMDAMEITGSAGAGLVQITITGKSEMRALKIDPSLVDPQEVEVLEDLIIAAFNDAKAKQETLMADEMGKVTGGMNIPGMKLPF
ncbi:MAG: YbaB/EbfC family nucleoid-associated protein [Candidatus Paracaedibacteraceae bacterium]|jgi:DNA-binding YbaB/EbfC family protein|nr:YbaB/EbfC family nucleoid-associated protein [Candidatus Paracaedibacteraceae bacterium]